MEKLVKSKKFKVSSSGVGGGKLTLPRIFMNENFINYGDRYFLYYDSDTGIISHKPCENNEEK